MVLLRGGQGRDDDAEGAEEEGEGLDEEEAPEDDEPVDVGKVTPFSIVSWHRQLIFCWVFFFLSDLCG